MYNHYIDTFLAVVAAGSFNGAADQLHLTSSGIAKQITSLEQLLGVALFQRSKHGILLTKNGQAFLRECHRLIEDSQAIIRNTRHPVDIDSAPIRVGASLLNPLGDFMQICRSHSELMKYHLRLVSFPTDLNTILPLAVQDIDLGEIGFASEQDIEYYTETDFVPFSKYKLTCAVPFNHPLAQKTRLELSDLLGQTLLFPSRGNPRLTAAFSSAMRRDYPEIKIESPSVFYDLDIFNYCMEENNLLVSLDCWNHIHPGMVNLPVDWDWSMPYGLIWKKNARKYVLDFAEAFKKAIKKGS